MLFLNAYLLFHNVIRFEPSAPRKFEMSFMLNDIEIMNSKNEPMQMFLGMRLVFVTGRHAYFTRGLFKEAKSTKLSQ